MALRISHQTADYQITRSTRKELIEALKVCGLQCCGKKDELVRETIKIRDERLDMHRLSEKLQEEAKQEAIAESKNNRQHTEAIEALIKGLQKNLEKQTDVLRDIKDRVSSSDEYSLVWQLEARLDDMFFANKYAGLVVPAIRHLERQLTDKRDQTMCEIVSGLEDRVSELTRTLLNDDSYRHNSTRESDSIKNRQEFRACQSVCRLFTQAVEAFNHDMTADSDKGVLHGGYISDYRY